MDPTAVILPGAQSLVTAMLTDTWSAVRTALARRWGRDGHDGPESPGSPDSPGSPNERDNQMSGDDQTKSTALERRLDEARAQALALAGESRDEAEHRARLEAFWAGYLAGLLAERPDMAALVREIAALRPETPRMNIQNTNSGSARDVLQSGDISGGVTFGGRR